MQTNLRALILLVASVGTVHAQPRPAKIFALPVYREPRHRLVFENAFVRLLDVRIPPGDTSRYHVHASRQIGVLIENGRTWAQQSGRPAESPDSVAIPIGTVADNARDTLPLTHRVGNGDRVTFHFVVGQLLSPSGISASVLLPTSGLRFDHESMGARVYRVRLAPGMATPMHQHARPGMTVQVGVGTAHMLQNIGTKPVELVEIDWP